MRTLIALLALIGCAYAQTYRTVTADTNNVIRTNFTLGAAQISGSFAISNVTGLQSALDAKLATNGDAFALTNFPALLLRTNGGASGLTNFPSSILQTNSSLSAFPAGLLRTNGDGSGLTNLPNANLSNAVGVLPLSNGGTGATNAGAARTALQLGSAATNDASAFQTANTNLTALATGDGSNLTNVTVTDASSLTNFPAFLLQTNSAETNFPAFLLRTNGDGSGLSNVSVDLTTVLPAYSNNAGKVLAVATGSTNVEWIAVSNTVTDASTLTNFPASILQTNSAAGSFPAFLLRTNGSAAGLTSFPTLNQNTTGTASNVTGVVAIANGGSGQTTAAAAIEAFLPAYAGNADRILALNSNANGLVWTTNAGGGGGSGTVTSVAMTVPAFLSVSGSPITTNGTFAVSLSGSALPLANGGTGAADQTGALQNLGIYVTNTTATGIKIGPSTSSRNYAIAIGQDADVTNQDYGIAIGADAKVSNSYAGVAIGASADALGEAAISIGWLSQATASGSVQLGRQGTNSTANTIQFLSAGTVDTNEWAALANAGTVGTNLLRSANITNAQAAIFTATTTNAPTNTNAPTPDAWLGIRVGTNDYKLPLWQ